MRQRGATVGRPAADGHGRATWPRFDAHPHGWFHAVGREIRAGRWHAVLAGIEPAEWRGVTGQGWRVMRSTMGIEVRPALVSPFLRVTGSQRITAIAIGAEVHVEITCSEMRWVDRFALDAFDVGDLGRAMLDQQELPHDNLPRLFPPTSRRQPISVEG